MKGIWATSALNNDQVAKALVLCYSLRLTHSRKPIAVLTSRVHVNLNLRIVLEAHFDITFAIEDDDSHDSNNRAECSVGVDDYSGKIFENIISAMSKKLKIFQQVAYLSPNILVIRNCDEIFTWFDSNGDDDDYSTSNYYVSDDKSFALFIPTWTMQQNKLEQKTELATDKMQLVNSTWLMHCSRVGSGGCHPLQNSNRIYLINLSDFSLILQSKELPNDVGSVCENAIRFWRNIYSFHVKETLDKACNQVTLHPQISTKNINQAQFANEPIAVIGMSCRVAAANNLDEFWNILVNGEITVDKPPKHRYSNGQFPPNFKMNAGYLKDPIDMFDNTFFGISAKEAIHMDPQHRLLFQVAWEALENAGISSEKIRNTPGGLFMGSWNYQYKNILNQANYDNEKNFYRNYMGSSSSACLGRLAMLLGFTGPTIANESSCSASAVAVHSACKSLHNGEATLALACGVNLIVTPFDRQDLPGMLAEDGKCKTFDVEANGYGRGEGCGVLVLKRLRDAARDGDRIWGIIRGSGLCQEGLTKSLATPTVEAEAKVMRGALKNAGVKPEQVSFLEMHGTGTVVGDATEVKAVADVYSAGGRIRESLLLASVKTNIGHTESCSGMASIIKVLLAMNYDQIPRQVGLTKLNPKLENILESIPAKVPMETIPWKRRSDGESRFAGVSSFGMTGTNVHFILEEAPITRQGFQEIFTNVLPERSLHIIKISAKSEIALNQLLEKYRIHLSDKIENSSQFSDIAYTANVGRCDWNHRAVVVASSTEKAAENIASGIIYKGKVSQNMKNTSGKVCFLFTGQGSQFPGMGKELYQTCSSFRVNFDYCLDIIKKIEETVWENINKAMCNSTGDTNSENLSCCHLSIFCLEYSLFKVWKAFGVKPDIVLGHSLGEFAAAVASDSLSVEQAIRLISERSRLISEYICKGSGGMLVVRKNINCVNKMLKQFSQRNISKNEKQLTLEVAAVNSADQTVVSGDSKAIEIFAKFCASSGVKSKLLERTSYAFHSAHMTPILKEYEKQAQSILCENPRIFQNSTRPCTYISGMTGKSVENLSELSTPKYWMNHTRKSVQFYGASNVALGMGTRIFVEVGPQPLLSLLTLNNAAEYLHTTTELLTVSSMKQSESEWMTLFEAVAKLYVDGSLKINWNAVDLCRVRKIVDLPHYPFIGKPFWPKLVSRSSSIANCGGVCEKGNHCLDSAPTKQRDLDHGHQNNSADCDCTINPGQRDDRNMGKEGLKTKISSIVKKVLKMEESDELSEDMNFEDMGVDSLMFMEIRNAVAQQLLPWDLQDTVSLCLVKKCGTVHQLINEIMRCIVAE